MKEKDADINKKDEIENLSDYDIVFVANLIIIRATLDWRRQQFINNMNC